MNILPRFKRRASVTKLKTVQMDGFPGGWNAVDDDQSMSVRYCCKLYNFRRTASGGQELRFGTKYVVDVTGVVDGDILDMVYFANRLIVVTEQGEIAAVDNEGAATAIWNTAIAALLPGSPTAWSSGLTTLDFVPFKNTLVIHNGTDKPLSITDALVVTYLQDLGTGSNVNVPIGKYGCVVGNYHVIAGVPSQPSTIYISSKATSGTFQGDPLPNDSISLDVGAYAPDSGAEIRGIAGYRNKLIVFFLEQAIVITLGSYDADENHVPVVEDSLPANYGLLGHRCLVKVENDILFADLRGISSVKRNLLSGLLETDNLSSIIAPEYQGTIGLQENDALLERSFMVHDRLANEVLTFSPDGRIFCYSRNEKLRYEAFSEYGGWTWTCGCTSSLGRVFFGQGTKIFQLGNRAFGELYYGDRLYDREADWANATGYTEGQLIYDAATDEVWQCLLPHTSAALGSFEADRTANPDNWAIWRGAEIIFNLELPWQDGKDIMRTKQMRFVNVQSKGTASFHLNLYVDNRYLHSDGVTEAHDPAIKMWMVGNDADGFGYSPNDDENFGGGRHGGDPRLWGFPVKFKTAKFRITGGARQPLMIIGISFLYAMGNFKR